jgi:single-strand DNA-binding protein
MSSFEVKGKLIVKEDRKQISEKFAKRDFVIETDDRYPQRIQIQLTQLKCDEINHCQLGDIVVAHCYLNGREWKSPQGEVKYFNTVEAWKVDVIQIGDRTGAGNAAASTATSQENQNTGNNATAQGNSSNATDDDLPF